MDGDPGESLAENFACAGVQPASCEQADAVGLTSSFRLIVA
jgi:hypothetical protein